MHRRGFLSVVLTAAAAPSIVAASSLMPIYTPAAMVLWADGVHDDAAAIQWLIDGRPVKHAGRVLVRSPEGVVMPRGEYLIGDTVRLRGGFISEGCRIYGNPLHLGDKPMLKLPAHRNVPDPGLVWFRARGSGAPWRLA